MILTKILLACSLLGLYPKYNNNEKTEFNYVSFGSSQTNGYGLHGFIPEPFYLEPSKIYGSYDGDRDGYFSSGYYFYSEKCYPVLVKEKLEKEYDKVNFHQCAINSMRAYDLAYILDESVPADAYVNWRLGEKFDWIGDIEKERNQDVEIAGQIYNFSKEKTNLKEEFIQSIKDADLISYDLGINDFTVYVANMILEMEDGGLFDNNLFNTLGKYARYYYLMKNVLEESILKNVLSVDEETVKTIGFVVDTLAYAFSGFILGFEKSMKVIYELNPDVEVVVVALQNMLDGYKVKLGDIEIDAGIIFGILTNAANLYLSSFSPYCTKYYFASFGPKQKATNFADEICAWDGNAETIPSNVIDCFDCYEEEFLVTSIVDDLVKKNSSLIKTLYGLGDDDFPIIIDRISTYIHFLTATVAKESLSNTVIDIENLDLSVIEEFASEVTSLDTINSIILNYVNGNDDQKVYENGKALMLSLLSKEGAKGSVAAVFILQFGNSFFSHPNEQGHAEIAELVYRAYKVKLIAAATVFDNAGNVGVSLLAKIFLPNTKFTIKHR